MKGMAVLRDRKRVHPLRLWWPTLLFWVGLALMLLSRVSPDVTDRVYSRSVYPFLVRTYGGLTSLVPVSVFELCILAAIALVLVFIGSRIYAAVKRKPRRAGIKQVLRWIINAASIIFFLFVIFGGLNYSRPGFADFSGLYVRPSSAQELADLCYDLTVQANTLKPYVSSNEAGVMNLNESYRETALAARQAFGLLSEDYDVFPELPITPKPVLNSWAMSYAQITGVFTPPTLEANVNTHAPDYLIPATMCHELAHIRGFMREDEANFIAYLACQKSEDPQFRYSGVMLALLHSKNRLAQTDRELYLVVDGYMDDEVRMDFLYNNYYWAQYDTPIADISSSVNDAYLRVNNQADGVKSYGRMVDLLLAEYRMKNGLEEPAV